MKAYDLQNYEIIRTQFFASANMTSVSISPNGIRFSVACIRKLAKSEYIEIQVHPHKHMLAVIPIYDRYKYKICWARFLGDTISVRAINAKAFLDMLYELFGWDIEKRYRLRGEIVRHGKDAVALFDASAPEIFYSRYNFEMPWTTGFGEKFNINKNAYADSELIMGASSEYNSHPDLQPTSQKIASKNIQTLIDKMHNGSDFNVSANIHP